MDHYHNLPDHFAKLQVDPHCAYHRIEPVHHCAETEIETEVDSVV